MIKGIATSLLFVLFVLSSFTLNGQSIQITEFDRIDEMMRHYKRLNQQETHIQAWRIQVITTDDRRKMEIAQGKFNRLYPGIKTSWKHVSPWYHLKAGAYKTKLELQGFLLEIKKDFPGAIPIVDRVRKEELLGP